MSLSLHEMDEFTLTELDDFTLNQLDNMSYDKLIKVVKFKNQMVASSYDSSVQLSEEQAQIIVNIENIYLDASGEEKKGSSAKAITVGVASMLIGEFTLWCIRNIANHTPEITHALRQALSFLNHLLNQQ